MALIHRATLAPTKLELLTAWLPTRDWYTAGTGELQRVATYRFDDPADRVGIETVLVRAGDGPVHQVPLTYRDAPLAGADAWLVGTAEHSVLGMRWVYDGCCDPVYAAALVGAILGHTRQADEIFAGDLERRAPGMTIVSTAAEGATVPAIGAIRYVEPSRIVADDVELVVARLPGEGELTGALLTGVWPGQETPLPLAAVLS